MPWSVDTEARPAVSVAPEPSASPRRRAGWTARLLLPSLAAAVFAVTLLQVLVVSEGSRTLFRDSDAGWHIRTGERILASGEVPQTDPYSFTHQGREWMAWEWLSDVILGATHRAGGLRGVALLVATVLATTALAWCALAMRLGANFFVVAAGAALLLGTTSIHWLARPHVFSWMLALLFVTGAEIRGRWLWVLPAAALLWANMHGSFLLGPAILALYALGYVLRRERPAAGRLAAIALACVAASLLNPYGWRLHAHIFEYLQNSYLMDRISEFRSFSFHSPGAIYVEGYLLAAGAGFVIALRRRAYPQALLIGAMLHQGLYSARHLPTGAVVAMPVALALITVECRTLGRNRLSACLDYGDRLRDWDRQMLGVAPLVLAVVLSSAALRVIPSGFDPETFPVQAATFFDTRQDSSRLFARDQWGGYLIYRFDGRLKVFVDGRSDFYGTDFLERYATIADVKPGWDTALDAERVNYVLVRPDQALAQALLATRRWRVAHADHVAVVFERGPG